MSKHHNPMGTPHNDCPKTQDFVAKTLVRTGRFKEHHPLTAPPWPAQYYQLHHSKLFNQLDDEKKTDILNKLGLDLLLGSFGIEKVGIGYCGRMSSTAETMEERLLFSMMGADEAVHYQLLCPYIPLELRSTYTSPFLSLMDQMLESDAPNILYYLSQIIIEGWGIYHYRALANQCMDPNLKAIIKQMLKDESSHHHTGKVLFKVNQLRKNDKAYILDSLKHYTDIIRLGTSQVIGVIDEVVGLSKNQKHELKQAIQQDKTTHYQLSIFKQLMSQPGMEAIVHDIERAGYFEVYPEAVIA